MKKRYFEACKMGQEQEAIFIKTISNREKNLCSDEDLNRANENLLTLRSIAETRSHEYKSEILKTNKIYDANEKKYFPIIEKLNYNEESRIYFLKCHFEKLSKIIEDFTISTYDFLNRLNQANLDINVDSDINLFKEKFNYIQEQTETSKVRIPREEFVNYDIYRRNFEALLNGSGKLGNFNNSLSLPSHQLEMSNNGLLVKLSKKSDKENKSTKIIDDFCSKIILESEINHEDIGKLLDLLDSNTEFPKLFLDKIIEIQKQNMSLKLLNFENLHHIASIINTITLKIELNEDKSDYDMNFAIIYIAERTFFAKPGYVKTYLCSIISKNNLYSTKKFWMDLINLKIFKKVENIMKSAQESNKILSPSESFSSSFSSPSTATLSTASIVNNTGLFSNLGSKFINYFTKPQSVEGLSEPMLKKVEKAKIHEVTLIIKEFIPHFSNFNYEISEAIDIIVEIATAFGMPKDKISYFIAILNSNIFTVKNKSKLEANNNSTINRKFKSLGNNKKVFEDNIKLVTLSLSFLNLQDYISLMQSNKKYNAKVSRKLHKKVLFDNHNLTMRTRLEVWKAILKISILRRKNKYKDVLLECSDPKNKYLLQSVHDIIALDVNRTPFVNNQAKNRESISNMLRAVAYLKPKINYCQGMNYIASFLLLTVQNEEEAFFFFYAMLESTDFGSIFLNDLKKLKMYFYVFERLLFLYLPEIWYYFRVNSINVSFFVSPWFITLLTNSYQYSSQKSESKVLLRIWDEFFIYGWRALIKAGMVILKNYEEHILQLKYEDLLHFLINDIIKIGFFNDTNYENFIKLSNSFEVKNGLLSNLENEFTQEEKLRAAEEAQFLEQSKAERKRSEPDINK